MDFDVTFTSSVSFHIAVIFLIFDVLIVVSSSVCVEHLVVEEAYV